MIKFDDLISVYRKISIVSYTNSELIEILKDDTTVNFFNILIECEKKFSKDNKEFLNCCSSACSSELKSFQNCVQANNGDLSHCVADSMTFKTCMTEQSNKILSILSKSQSFKV